MPASLSKMARLFFHKRTITAESRSRAHITLSCAKITGKKETNLPILTKSILLSYSFPF